MMPRSPRGVLCLWGDGGAVGGRRRSTFSGTSDHPAREGVPGTEGGLGGVRRLIWPARLTWILGSMGVPGFDPDLFPEDHCCARVVAGNFCLHP
ncbi:MAG: hypothetical protein CM1200mP2_51640 [Planctomycetaceae bacterium]|nr:MAG: hypothetical protein CM1200mP2_51640 [Planctomycetaceae bacterium]